MYREINLPNADKIYLHAEKRSGYVFNRAEGGIISYKQYVYV